MRFLNFIRGKAIKAKAAVAGFFRNTAKNFREDFTPSAALTTAQRDARRIRAVRRITSGFMLASMMMSVMGGSAFAAEAAAAGGSEGVDTFNTVVEFIVDWVARIGLVIGFIGAVQFAMGFKDDSADGKTRGLMCLASGFIVFAVAKAYDMFTV
ncbi:MAG: hypothetical protein NC401_14095 [Ruminococcus sp.]|nr:hypothetical protein [Ruminococcus sp.]